MSDTGKESNDTRFLMAAEYIRRLTDDEKTPVTFQVFDDSPNKDPKKARVYSGTLRQHFNRMLQHNDREQCGIFCTVNTTDLRGRKMENMVAVRAILADDDDGVNTIEGFPIRPLMAVCSSRVNGIEKKQFYWPVAGGAIDQYDGIIERLVESYRVCPGGSKGLNRVLRVPGFYHQKDPENPQLVKIIHMTDAPPYSWEQIVKAFPPIGGSKTKVNKLQNAFDNDPVLQHLRSGGYVIEEHPNGKIHIECPFAVDHTTASAVSSTTYFVAHTNGYKWGHFKCQHGHCLDRPREDFLKAIGYVAGDRQPEREPGDEPFETEKPAFEFIHISEVIKDLKPIEWRVHNIFMEQGFSFSYGDTGTYKTFKMLDMFLCISAGIDYHGHPVKQGTVFYICGEGQQGVGRRVVAWGIEHKIKIAELPFFMSRVPTQLMDIGHVDDVKKAVDLLSKINGPPAMLGLDTLARNFGAGDESKTADMNTVVSNLDVAFGNSLCRDINHHTGHTNTDRERGSIVLRQAVDSRFQVSLTPTNQVLVKCWKQKDAPRSEPMLFNIKTIPLIIGNQPDSSCVLELAAEGDDAEEAAGVCAIDTSRVSVNMNKAVNVLDEMYLEYEKNLERDGRDSVLPRVEVRRWREECIKRGLYKRNSTFIRAYNSMLEREMIFTDENGAFVYTVLTYRKYCINE